MNNTKRFIVITAIAMALTITHETQAEDKVAKRRNTFAVEDAPRLVRNKRLSSYNKRSSDEDQGVTPERLSPQSRAQSPQHQTTHVDPMLDLEKELEVIVKPKTPHKEAPIIKEPRKAGHLNFKTNAELNTYVDGMSDQEVEEHFDYFSYKKLHTDSIKDSINWDSVSMRAKRQHLKDFYAHNEQDSVKQKKRSDTVSKMSGLEIQANFGKNVDPEKVRKLHTFEFPTEE